MRVDRIEIFKAFARIEGEYNEVLFRSLLDENYDNFCRVCSSIDDHYDEINNASCSINEAERTISFTINDDVKKYDY